MKDLKDKLKERSPIRQEIKPVNILKAEINQADRPLFEEDRPTVNISEKPKRQSVRVSYQFFADQYPKMVYIREQYNKRRRRQGKKPLPLSFFSKRAFDEFIARCMTKIEQWERDEREATDRP